MYEMLRRPRNLSRELRELTSVIAPQLATIGADAALEVAASVLEGDVGNDVERSLFAGALDCEDSISKHRKPVQAQRRTRAVAHEPLASLRISLAHLHARMHADAVYLGAARTSFALLEARVIVASRCVVCLLVEAHELALRQSHLHAGVERGAFIVRRVVWLVADQSALSTAWQSAVRTRRPTSSARFRDWRRGGLWSGMRTCGQGRC